MNITCPKCSTVNPSSQAACIKCGQAISSPIPTAAIAPPMPANHRRYWIIGGAAGIGMLLLASCCACSGVGMVRGWVAKKADEQVADGINAVKPDVKPKAETIIPAEENKEKVTRANYIRIAKGMTEGDVERFLGPGQHEVRNVSIEGGGMGNRAAAFGGSIYTVTWQSRDGRCRIQVTFEDNAVIGAFIFD